MSSPIPIPWEDMFDVADNGCWIWNRFINGAGYGQMRPRETGTQMAHRHSWILANGPIPAGLTIDHLCFVPACVNPAHMQLLTGGDNAARCRRAMATTCKYGHERTPENTYNYTRENGRGSRPCRVCRLAYCQVYKTLTPQERVARRAAGLPLVDLAAHFAASERAA